MQLKKLSSYVVVRSVCAWRMRMISQSVATETYTQILISSKLLLPLVQCRNVPHNTLSLVEVCDCAWLTLWAPLSARWSGLFVVHSPGIKPASSRLKGSFFIQHCWGKLQTFSDCCTFRPWREFFWTHVSACLLLHGKYFNCYSSSQVHEIWRRKEGGNVQLKCLTISVLQPKTQGDCFLLFLQKQQGQLSRQDKSVGWRSITNLTRGWRIQWKFGFIVVKQQLDLDFHIKLSHCNLTWTWGSSKISGFYSSHLRAQPDPTMLLSILSLSFFGFLCCHGNLVHLSLGALGYITLLLLRIYHHSNQRQRIEMLRQKLRGMTKEDLERVNVVGNSGSGKSTLAKKMAAILGSRWVCWNGLKMKYACKRTLIRKVKCRDFEQQIWIHVGFSWLCSFVYTHLFAMTLECDVLTTKQTQFLGFRCVIEILKTSKISQLLWQQRLVPPCGLKDLKPQKTGVTTAITHLYCTIHKEMGVVGGKDHLAWCQDPEWARGTWLPITCNEVNLVTFQWPLHWPFADS